MLDDRTKEIYLMVTGNSAKTPKGNKCFILEIFNITKVSKAEHWKSHKYCKYCQTLSAVI